MKLNEKILHYRKAAKLSQEELAAQVGVSGLGGFGGMGEVEFSPNTPPELQQQILEELGLAPAASPLGGIERFALGFATIILVLGIVTMIAGAALAVYLYQKGNKKP